ncbi:MAG: TAXI family TRAP transporter solute-binding subunit, partial [Dehalococcoidia bacterium]|nr:TAXI family TRAP transporter solute-binding subunit [Dehalococcoidia bacterium]
GMIDVSLQAMVYTGEKWIGAPAAAELMATKPTYFVSLGDPAAHKIAREKSGYPIGTVTLKPGELGPTQTDTVYAVDFPNNWYVDASMDAEIVYELVKTIQQHAGEFGSYTADGKGLNQKNIGGIAIDEKDFHPGAVKLFKEKGVKIGLD